MSRMISRVLRAKASILARSPPQPCFTSNTDVAGLGVRVSTYLQSLLLLITMLVLVFDTSICSRRRKELRKTYTTLLVTAFALLLAAIIQAVTSVLSIYHALLVLDLCWLLITNVLVICILPTIDGQSRNIDQRRKWIQRWWPSEVGQLRPFLLVSAHLCAIGAFGIYVWSNPTRLTHSPDCTQSMITHVFTAPESAANNGLRIASLFVYSIAAIPILNVVIFSVFALLIVNFVNLFTVTPYTYARLYRLTVLIQGIMTLLLIISVELTVRRNKGLFEADGEIWGFGQTLVLFVALGPLLWTVITLFRTISRSWDILGRLKAYTRYWIRGLLRESAVPWSGIYEESNERINAVLTFLRFEHEQRNSPELEAISHALRTAKAFLAAAHKALGHLPIDQQKEVEEFALSRFAPPTSLEHAEHDVEQILEHISRACELRFIDVRGSISFFIVQSYLEATKAVLDSVDSAIKACCVSHML